MQTSENAGKRRGFLDDHGQVQPPRYVAGGDQSTNVVFFAVDYQTVLLAVFLQCVYHVADRCPFQVGDVDRSKGQPLFGTQSLRSKSIASSGRQ